MRKEWNLATRRVSTIGTAPSALDRFHGLMGPPKKIKMHPRGHFAPRAPISLDSPEKGSEAIGRWSPGSKMSDVYDRAVCATELEIRAGGVESNQGRAAAGGSL